MARTTLSHREDEIENAAGLHGVDVVYLQEVDNDFKNIILKTGRVIYERRNRNKTSHIYDKEESEKIFQKIKDQYAPYLQRILAKLISSIKNP